MTVFTKKIQGIRLAYQFSITKESINFRVNMKKGMQNNKRKISVGKSNVRYN